MHRRDLLKIISMGAALPALTPDLLAMMQDAHPASGYTPKTLTPHQNETLVVMTDLIIPVTDTPGAKAAKVNEFIDVVLTGWATEAERTRFLTDLDAVDKRTNLLFGKNFVALTVPQQEDVLRALDEETSIARYKEKLLNPTGEEEDDDAHYSQLNDSFFEVLKRLTLTGYYTSEIGFTQELKEKIIPGAFHGCTPLPAENKA